MRLGGGVPERDPKEEDFFLNVMPSSHTPVDHGGKQAAAEKGISKLRALHVSHVRFHILGDSCSVDLVLLLPLFPCGSHKITAAEMLLVCGGDSNRPGQLQFS